MPVPSSSQCLAYVDASYSKVGSGGGYVARFNDRLVLGAYPLEGMEDNNQAESCAALYFVAKAMTSPVPPSRIDLMTDSKTLVHSTKWAMNAVSHNVALMSDLCQEAGASLSMVFCKGHSQTASAAGFLNDCADKLAELGAAGETLSWNVPFDAFWRMRIMECHERLHNEGQGLTRQESADYLGLAPEVVDHLYRHGHLRHIPGRSLIGARSLMEVKREVLAQGIKIPLRDEPLRSIRGRVDEAESGFGRHVRVECPVQAVVHILQTQDDIAAVISLEGPKEDEIFSARFERNRGPAWEPVLEGLLDMLWDRYPQCDHLTVVTPDAGLLKALNGLGPWSDLSTLCDLDDRIWRDELSIVNQGVPPEWKSPLGWAWQVSIPKALFEDMAETGKTGGWRVVPHFDPRKPPMLRTTGYEPPWVALQEDVERARP